MERSNCLGQNLEVFLFIKIILCKCDYFMSGQPWHYPCIADLECDFTEEPSMDYIGLAIVLGRMPLLFIGIYIFMELCRRSGAGDVFGKLLLCCLCLVHATGDLNLYKHYAFL